MLSVALTSPTNQRRENVLNNSFKGLGQNGGKKKSAHKNFHAKDLSQIMSVRNAAAVFHVSSVFLVGGSCY